MFLKNYLCQSVLLVGCCFVGISRGMELPESHKREREEEEEIVMATKRLEVSPAEYSEHETIKEEEPFEKLPSELIEHIATFLTSAASVDDAIKNIQSFARSQKSLYAILTDLQGTDKIIKLLSERFKKEPLDIALLLRTPAVPRWLERYLEKNPQLIGYLRNKLVNDPQAMSYLKNKLVQATRKGDLPMVTFLANAGTELNEYRETISRLNVAVDTPLVAAARQGNDNVVDILIRAGATINQGGEDYETPLIAAAKNGHLSTVDMLIKAGGDIDKEDAYGRTPLHAVAQYGKDVIAARLLQAGAKINKRAQSAGDTPLYTAVQNGHLSTVDMLIKAGADYNIQGFFFNKYTPLYLAVLKGYDAIVARLIKAGADVNKANKDGWTPLMVAVISNDAAIVSLLLQAGATPAAKNTQGKTALDLAQEKGYTDSINVIEKAAHQK
jgi:ankyrin repeat protein